MPDSPIAPLTVATLGRFAVTRGAEPLPETVWTREKARRLFQYFVTHHGRVTAKERIVDDLWPALDARRADRDFKVALTAVNSALEPDRPSGALSVYVVRHGGAYGLNPDAPVAIDARRFERRLLDAATVERSDPPAALPAYRAALELYHGEYLPDAIYEDWSTVAREQYTALFLTGATRLAELLLEAGSAVETIVWSRRVIAVDSCWEAAYRALMRAYAVQGNRPQVARTYQACVAALRDQLDLAPMRATTQLYEQALAAGSAPATDL